MREITGGEVLARCLTSEGVSFVFGLPCPEIDPLLAALERAKATTGPVVVCARTSLEANLTTPMGPMMRFSQVYHPPPRRPISTIPTPIPGAIAEEGRSSSYAPLLLTGDLAYASDGRAEGSRAE